MGLFENPSKNDISLTRLSGTPIVIVIDTPSAENTGGMISTVHSACKSENRKCYKQARREFNRGWGIKSVKGELGLHDNYSSAIITR